MLELGGCCYVSVSSIRPRSKWCGFRNPWAIQSGLKHLIICVLACESYGFNCMVIFEDVYWLSAVLV